MRTVRKTPYHSFCIGEMPKGCRLCVMGLKEVVFVTGICPRKPHCFFCPISEKKFGKDVIYANEWPLEKLQDVITEAKLCESKGAGLTGGDPLSRLERTLKIIRMLKKKFGKAFHIHLYTSLNLVTEKALRKLEKAGLDEIRYHPDLNNLELWHKISLNTSMSKGVEIPVIPGKEKETKKLIDFINGKVSFLNLNELELSDTNVSKLYEMGFIAKDAISYAVKGSDAMARKLLEYCLGKSFNVHYCTVRLKDTVQLVARIKRRLKNVKKDFDIATRDGTLRRAAIYTKAYTPEMTLARLEKINKAVSLQALNRFSMRLQKDFKIPKRLLLVDEKKLRILTSEKTAKKLKKAIRDFGFIPYIVEELPTYDQFEIQSEEI